MDIPGTEPVDFVAGDTVKWTKALTDYLPADGWALKYVFTTKGASFDVTATDNGDGSHLVTLSAATTAVLVPAEYRYQAFATKAADRYTVASGAVTVKPNFENYEGAGKDNRTHAEKALELLEAAIEDRIPAGMESFSIAGRAINLMAPSDLREWRDYYRRDVAREKRRERRAQGLANSGRVGVQF